MQFEGTALVLLIILCFGIIAPELFRKLKLPYVTVLILIGALSGPGGFGYVREDAVLEFLGFLGSAFLMLMAGMEVRLSHLEQLGKRIGMMAVLNGIIPFGVGVFIMRYFGYGWLPAILVGTVFISSSVAIVASGVRAAGLARRVIGETIVSTTVLLDIVSLLLLAIILQTLEPMARLPLPLYFVVLVASVVILKKFLPMFAKQYLHHVSLNHKKDDDEAEMRFVIAVLIGSLLYFSGLGVHPIVAAFAVGVLLSDVIKSEHLFRKIHTIGYGLFVPVFFFVIGMKMDLSLFTQFDVKNVFMLSIVAGLIAAKLVSGYLGAKLAKFSGREAAMFGVASTAQLTTTLAVTYAASAGSILGPAVVTGIVALSIITTVASPMVLNLMSARY